MKHPKVWYAVTDGGRARILQKQSSEEPFSLQQEFLSHDLHQPSRRLGAAKPGRTHESAGATRHAIQPRRDLHKASKEDFVRKVAQELNAANKRGEFDLLVLAAPPHALQTLDKALDISARRKIAGRLQKDLTKLPMEALEAQFQPLRMSISAKWR